MAESGTKKHSSRKNSEFPFLCENLSFAGKEAYKRLRTNLQFCFPDQENCGVVGITSSHPAEGKSLTSINLCYSLAQLNKRVLLIDADMRRSSIASKLGLRVQPGMSNLLMDVNNAANVLQEYIPSDDSYGFFFLAAGDAPPNPSELLHSARMNRLMEGLRTKFDYIVLDLPPVGAVSDAQTVSTLVDGMLIVVREDHTPKPMLEECIKQLQLTNSRILGFVINGAVEGSSKSYSYGKYGKYGKYGSYSNYYKGYYK